MKIRTVLVTFLIFILTSSLLLSCSSNQSGSTIDEPEITISYLKGEYSEQLLRDGAEHVFGTIDIKMRIMKTAITSLTKTRPI